MATKETNLILVVVLCFLFFISPFQASTDTILQGQQLRDSEELFSADGYFRLGFFSPGRSENRYLGFFGPGRSKTRYLGIFYNQHEPYGERIQNAVWVANRNTPISDRSGILVIDEYGKMKISYSGANSVVLCSIEGVSNASATLLGTGNFMLRELNSDGSPKRILWQSFDYPTDTLLPGMKLGVNFKTGQTWSLTSWISEDVPAPGSFKLGVGGGADPNGTRQLIIWWQGKVYWSSGIWLNGQFKQVPLLSSNSKQNWSYTSNENETYFTYSMNEKYTFPLYKMESTGQVSTEVGTTTFSECYLFHYRSRFDFDYGSSHFPTEQIEYAGAGCVKEILPKCRKNITINIYEDKAFVLGYGFKFDDSHNLSLFDCRANCMNNCSCVAYANTTANEIGCVLWGQEVKFIRPYYYDDRRTARTIYFITGQEVPVNAAKSSRKKKDLWMIWLVIAVAGVPVILVLSSLICFKQRRERVKENSRRCLWGVALVFKKWGIGIGPVLWGMALVFKKWGIGIGLVFKLYLAKIKRNIERRQEALIYEIGATSRSGISKKLNKDGNKSHDLRFFSFKNIASATDNFASGSKLGEGGYGPVYKGKLQSGQEIAIKRLSRSSGQGIAEFKNELALIARLQHTNLVRLLGCCIQRGEKMLIYEYMPNKSLDFFLFDPMRRNLLDWEKRFVIIQGVAQGLLYLHKYSRLRIIHRDLKAGNILLDEEMNPKISDFGMARLFEQNESKANTNRIVGTHGYMSPEYAMDGICSMKSDVFSFGVLLLEIVSGTKNNSYYHPEHPLTLTGHAWELWKEGRCLELLDPTLGNSYQNNEVLRCIHVGLLCVQDSPTDRPSMSDIAAMISYENIPLSAPKQPAFFINRSSPHAEIVDQRLEIIPSNRVTITEMDAR